MIKEAIETILNIQENKIHEIEGRSYTEKSLILVEAPRYKPTNLPVGSLDAIVKLVKAEIGRVTHPIYIEVSAHNKVEVYTSFMDRFDRQSLYTATSDTPAFRFEWKDYESALIAFRSQFEQTDSVKYVLDLLSKISDENSVSTTDNGLSQTVEVKKGVALKSKEVVKPIVKLRPYRTFLEIEQPESEFLLRLAEGGNVGLFEADGGMWKLTAKNSIKAYFEAEFKDTEDVIVMI